MKCSSLVCRAGVLATLFLLTAFAPAADAQAWYPLVEGAEWIYRTPTADVTVTIESQSEILGATRRRNGIRRRTDRAA